MKITFIELSNILSKSEYVRSFSNGNNFEPATMAHGLIDLDESFKKCIPLIESLQSDTISEENINDILFELNEEFMHVVYHINDMQVFNNRVSAIIEASNKAIFERNNTNKEEQDNKKINHPYREFEKSDLWNIINSALIELQSNNDIELTTRCEYVIGFLCKNILSNLKLDIRYQKD